MAKSNFPGVQHLAWETFCQVRCINFITQHRVTNMMKMHANLMGASAMQPALDKTRLISRTNDAILRFGRASAREGHAHSLPMDGMSSDFFFDQAGLFPQFSGDERKVNLFDRAFCKLLRQIPMRFVVFGNNKTAARFFVEAVNDSGPFFPTDSGKGRAMAEQCVDQGMLLMTRARMNDEPSRFIDDDEIAIFEENLQRNRLWLILDLFERRLG